MKLNHLIVPGAAALLFIGCNQTPPQPNYNTTRRVSDQISNPVNNPNGQVSPGSPQQGGIIAEIVNYQEPTPYSYPAGYNDPTLAPNKHLLVWTTNPAQEATISWSLPDLIANTQHNVYLSEQQRNGSQLNLYEMKVPAQESGMDQACNSQLPIFQSRVTGLKPNTTYFYVIESNGQQSQEMHFVTAPANSTTSFKLFSGGDSRSDPGQRVVMNRQISSLLSQDSSYLALIHGGDFIESGSNCEQWSTWLDNHQSTMTSKGRVLPVVATFGNHESGGEAQFTALFGDPLGGEKFYFNTKIGSLDLIILNSEISVEGTQRQWLTTTMNSLAKQATFIIAGYHRPAWPAEKSPGSTTSWIPIFEQNQVDLVFESDGHVLKQTCPIFNNACNPERGIVYVGEGGLGVAQRGASQSGQWYFEGGYAIGQHHIQSLSFQMNSATPQIEYKVYYDNTSHYPLTLRKRNR
ncbi:purple acid phosphatase family protein [Pseudobacteriovorax antillogorgiicola]|uniref:Calcineurin-like phosphoesterase n=1 Tax=Pseudobacteriovorax antillogorgiicola TaxID=1513793 RepID=A0A1Y6BUX4_9BACT|nr:metallophosphoesterase family protein [Pseudobacteriovorax antillogorgiicola]TCS52458.1 calcineurin-like phosphoesterase family protein [Pseudobacteriovorax antillogorgiicola]SMF28446.1 Calcineurin-like phosphoesterase [Pseudobacteriovorax antillogorgiicola]